MRKRGAHRVDVGSVSVTFAHPGPAFDPPDLARDPDAPVEEDAEVHEAPPASPAPRQPGPQAVTPPSIPTPGDTGASFDHWYANGGPPPHFAR